MSKSKAIGILLATLFITGTLSFSSFNAKAEGLNGWVSNGSTWSYYINGSKATGWISYGGCWYYLDSNGDMKTGWVKDGDKWYYMYSNGALAVSTVTPDNYIVGADGAWTGATATRTFTPESYPETVKVNGQGQEVEYYHDNFGKIYYNLPMVTRTVIPENGTSTIKYNVDLVSYMDADDKPHEIWGQGDYVTANNVVRESEYSHSRMLYAKGPVTINFHGTYENSKLVKRVYKSKIENGKLLYTENASNYLESQKLNILNSVDNGKADETVTLTEAGLYTVTLHTLTGPGVVFYLYVSNDTSELNYTAPKTETATAGALSVAVNGTNYAVPAYSINGDSYVRLKDFAYTIKDTKRRVTVCPNPMLNRVTLLTYMGTSAYQPLGGELSSLPYGNVTATPSTIDLVLDNGQIYPADYKINGEDFVKLSSMATIFGFDMTNNNGSVTLGTSTSSSVPASTNNNTTTGTSTSNVTVKQITDSIMSANVAAEIRKTSNFNTVRLIDAATFTGTEDSLKSNTDTPIMFYTQNGMHYTVLNSLVDWNITTVEVKGGASALPSSVVKQLSFYDISVVDR